MSSDLYAEWLGETGRQEAERPKWLLKVVNKGELHGAPGGGSETLRRPTTFTSLSPFLETSFRPAAAPLPYSVPVSSLHLLAGREDNCSSVSTCYGASRHFLPYLA